jgi:hypothetical protein
VLIEVVVLPTPPFWFATAITRGRLRVGVCEGVDDSEVSLIDDTLPRIALLRNPLHAVLFPGKQFLIQPQVKTRSFVSEISTLLSTACGFPGNTVLIG